MGLRSLRRKVAKDTFSGLQTVYDLYVLQLYHLA